MKKIKRVLAVLLAVVMLMCMASTANATVYDSPTVYVSYTGQVVNTITFNGKTVQAVYAPYHSITNYDGSSYSCAAFVSKFYNICFGIGVNNLFPGSQPNVYSGSGSFSRTSSPVVGDILGSDGHWAIVKAVSGNIVTIIEQNCWKDNERTTARYDRRVSLPDGEYKYLWHYSGNNGGSTHLDLGNDFYAYIAMKESGKTIEARNGNIQIAAYGNSVFNASQLWHFIKQANNSYKIINLHDGGVIDLENSQTNNGNNIETWTDNGGANQRWFIVPNGNGYGFKTACGNAMMDCTGASSAPGTNIEIWKPNSSSAQIFDIVKVDYIVKGMAPTSIGSDFYAYISSAPSSNKLSNTEGDLRVAQANDKNDCHQIWHFLLQNDNSYKIINEYDQTVVDLARPDGSVPVENHTNIQLYTSNDFKNQRWLLYKENNKYFIRSAMSNMFMTCFQRNTGANTNICTFEFQDGNWQQFLIEKISYTKPAKPAASTVSLWVLNTANKTSWLSWTDSPLKDSKFDNRSYTLILTKNGAAYQTKTDLISTSIDLTLPAGTYTAKIRAINTKYKNYYTDGNTLNFTVGNHIHSYTSTITKPATCSATGVRTYTCSCGDSYTETIAKNASNHVNTVNISATASTCTVSGYTAGVYCNDCKQYISGHHQQPLAAHTITIINQRDATYDAEGYTGDEYCTVCKQTIKQGTVIQKLDKPADPTPDTPDEPQTKNLCKWCGKTHTGFIGGLVGFFHRIFAAIFGARH